jgi:hypothetical protein
MNRIEWFTNKKNGLSIGLATVAFLFSCLLTGPLFAQEGLGSKVSGSELRALLTGKTIVGTSKKGRYFHKTFEEGGKLVGNSIWPPNKAITRGGERPDSDTGKWWIEKDRQCHQWKRWGKGKPWCHNIYKRGGKYHSYSETGGKRATWWVE